ncbi:hypothetical protein MPC4_110048 [Methylocella tundrae]|uniref:Uncharacterized protein n=1 Tax=Methylocella tundrae TaxID=227605 RepID=A0A8B6M1N6_METTU|nr:hypothetical protein MPC1_6200003 [Methylocella tundrae]VTZ48748.1 hypothetical protein MPC4_110048 [Methylocella tundrae]
MIIVKNQDADRNSLPAAFAERTDDRHVGTTADEAAFPFSGRRVSTGGPHYAVQECFDDPGISKQGAASETVAPIMVFLEVIGRAD